MTDKLEYMYNGDTLESSSDVQLAFICPGCECYHSYRIKGKDPKWDWNGSMDKPTFSPSLLCQFIQYDKQKVCHLFIRDGKIQFLSDCSHKLAGQTVDMLDIKHIDVKA